MEQVRSAKLCIKIHLRANSTYTPSPLPPSPFPPSPLRPPPPFLPTHTHQNRVKKWFFTDVFSISSCISTSRLIHNDGYIQKLLLFNLVTQDTNFENLLFCPYSTFNIRKSHKISSRKAFYFRSYQPKTSRGVENTPSRVRLGLVGLSFSFIIGETGEL